MKKFFKSIILILVALVVVIVGGAYLISPVAVVERAAVMPVPPDKVYAVVGTLKRFNEWSPWAGLDPATAYHFEGPDGGVGQKMTWASNNPNVGSGAQTVIEAVPSQKVVTEVDFGDMGKSVATMTLNPVAGGTNVTWRFSAESNGIIERWMSLMFDKWIGADYEKGLTNLKAIFDKESAGG